MAGPGRGSSVPLTAGHSVCRSVTQAARHTSVPAIRDRNVTHVASADREGLGATVDDMQAIDFDATTGEAASLEPIPYYSMFLSWW